MSSATLYRASGLALLLSLLLLLIGFVLRTFVPVVPTPPQEASALYISSNAMLFSGVALLLLGLGRSVRRCRCHP